MGHTGSPGLPPPCPLQAPVSLIIREGRTHLLGSGALTDMAHWVISADHNVQSGTQHCVGFLLLISAPGCCKCKVHSESTCALWTLLKGRESLQLTVCSAPVVSGSILEDVAIIVQVQLKEALFPASLVPSLHGKEHMCA